MRALPLVIAFVLNVVGGPTAGVVAPAILGPADTVVASNHRTVTQIDTASNLTCGELTGTAYQGEFKLDAGAFKQGDHQYVIAATTGTATLTINLDFNANAGAATQFTFSESSRPINAVYVKGGTGQSQLYEYNPPVTADSQPLSTQSGGGISHISFCVPLVDVSVLKTAATTPIAPGDTASFSIAVENTGLIAATDVQLTDTLPSGLTWSLGGPDAASCGIAAGVLSCNFGSLAAGTTRTITLSATTTAAACGTIENTALVSATNEQAAQQGNNSSTASIQVTCLPALAIDKTPDDGTATSGDAISFTIEVRNTGNAAASDVLISDSLPAGFSWFEDPDTTECAISGSDLSCSIASLAAGASFSVTVSALTDAETPCGLIPNTASASATDVDQVSDPGDITIACPGLSASKVADTTSVNAGDQIGFTITVSNGNEAGTGTARNVQIDDPLPGGDGIEWSVESSTEDSCWIEGSAPAQTLKCDFGDLAAGASASVHLVSDTSGDSCSLYNNVATVSADNHAELTPSASITVLCPELQMTKLADESAVSAGQEIGFSMTVTNLGPGAAYDVTLTDALPGGLDWTDDSDDCEILGETLSCNFGTLEDGASASVRVSAPTGPSDCSALDNTAFADASNNPDGPVDASDRVTVECSGLSIDKSADSEVIDAGDVASFTIVIWNQGPGTAFDVTFSDTLAGFGWSMEILQGTAESCISAASFDPDQEAWSCDFGDLAPSAMDDGIVIRFSRSTTPDDCGVLDNTAFAHDRDGDEVDDSASVQIDCPAAPTLVIDKAADVETVHFTLDADGNVASIDPAVVTWTLTWTLTDGPVTNAVITDQLPAGLSYVSGSASDGGTFDAATRTLSWSFATLGASGSVTFQTTTDADAPEGVPIVNVATIVSDQTAEDEGIDSITVTSEVVLGPEPPEPPKPPKLPDTATTLWLDGRPVAVVPVALLALVFTGSIGALALANVRAVRRRR